LPDYLANQLPIRSGRSAYRSAFSPDARLVAIASEDRLEYWDAQTFQPTGISLNLTSLPEALAFSPDGRILITGHERGGAQRWDVATGERLGAPLPHRGTVCGVCFSPDGTAIVTACADGTAQIWDSRTGECLGAPFAAGETVFDAAFGPEGRSILIGAGTEGRSGAAYLWDITTRALLAGPLTHPDSVCTVAINPAGTTLLTGSRDGTAQVWDTQSGAPSGAPLRHLHPVTRALLTPDGAKLLTACKEDLAIYQWDAATGQRIGTPLWHLDAVECLAVSPDGRTVLSGGADQSARLWEVARCRSRPLDPAQRTKRAIDPGPKDRPNLPEHLLKKTVVYSPDNYAIAMVERPAYCATHSCTLRSAASGSLRVAPPRCGRATGRSKIESGESSTINARRGQASWAPLDGRLRRLRWRSAPSSRCRD
jgi:WD40 repeat protein